MSYEPVPRARRAMLNPIYRTVECAGLRIAYLELGDGPDLLFLHGGGLRASTYRELLLLLAESYHVIAPDIPCFGQSSVPRQVWSFSDYGRVFSTFTARLGLQHVSLMGHSFGGGVALALADSGVAVDRLVLIDSAGAGARCSLLQFFYFFFIKKSWNSIRRYGVTDMTVRAVGDFFLNDMRHIGHSGTIIRTIIRCIRERYVASSRVTVPTLILWGREDELFPLSVGEELQQSLSASKLITLEGNHDWCLFEPDTVAAEVGAFLASVRPSPAAVG